MEAMVSASYRPPLKFVFHFMFHFQNKKFCRKDFGECPRYFCKGQAVLPVSFP